MEVCAIGMRRRRNALLYGVQTKLSKEVYAFCMGQRNALSKVVQAKLSMEVCAIGTGYGRQLD